MLDETQVFARMRQALEDWPIQGRTVRYAAAMWRFTLARWERGGGAAEGNDENCDAIPYVPIDPEDYGLVLDAGSQVLDLGCLAGYGLHDFARRRLHDGKAVPVLTGIDIDEDCVAMGRRMAEVWGQGLDVRIETGDSGSLPLADASCGLVIARLLLPYVRVRRTVREMARVMTPNAIALFQVHAFRYYTRQAFRSARAPRAVCYYIRPIVSGLFLKLTGRQPRHPWFAETAIGVADLRHLCGQAGLVPVWRGGFASRPLMAFRKAAGAPAGKPLNTRPADAAPGL